MSRSALAVALMLACGRAWPEPPVRADDPRIARMGRTVAQADGSLRFADPGVRCRSTPPPAVSAAISRW